MRPAVTHRARFTADKWRRQTGAALVVGLVLMLVLTILGISGINSATLELTMAANSQARQMAFQAAESGIDIALTGLIDPGVPHARATHDIGDGLYQADTEVRCVAMTPIPEGAPGGDSNARAMHFEVTAVGRGPRNAVSRLTQGFYVVVPSATRSDSDAEASAEGDCSAQTVCLGLHCTADGETQLPVRTYWRQDDIDD